MNERFDKPKQIIHRLNQAGYEAFFVGGSVRDILLGREIGDVDIATSALPEDVMSLFPKTIPVGIEHGTVIVQLEHEMYEVTTFRTEGDYQDHRRPSEVLFVSSLVEDLKRRDFTINAMAMTADGHLIDPFKGKNDLDRRIIRTVGDPKERFSEDALRMMRAIRFSSQLSFSLDRETKLAIKEHGHMLGHISMERIAIEFEKILLGQNAREALQHLVDTELYRYLPALADRGSAIMMFARLPIHRMEKAQEMWTAFVLTLQFDEVKTFFRQWKQPRRLQQQAQTFLNGIKHIQQEGWTIEIIYQFGLYDSLSMATILSVLNGDDDKSYLEALALIRRFYQSLPIKSRKQLQVNGDDLMHWFSKKAGPWIEEYLQLIERAILNGNVINERDQIREWLDRCNRL